QGAIAEVGQGCANGRGGHDRNPVDPRVELLHRDLSDDRCHEHDGEDCRSYQIAPIMRMDIGMKPSHRDGVAAGFAESRCSDFDDPEYKGDLRDLAQNVTCRQLLHVSSCSVVNSSVLMPSTNLFRWVCRGQSTSRAWCSLLRSCRRG